MFNLCAQPDEQKKSLTLFNLSVFFLHVFLNKSTKDTAY